MGDGARGGARPAEELVPAWLALIVLILLLAVVGVGGYLIRLRLEPGVPRTSQDLAVAQALAQTKANPNDTQAMLDLAFAYQQDGLYQEALGRYDQVLKVDPKSTGALYNKGMIYFKLEDPKKAEELLWDTLDVSKTHVLAAKALGDYYAGKRQYRSLLVAVKPAADARPDMADLQYLMGVAYEHLGHKDWAIARYRDALRYVPDMKECNDALKRLGAEK